MIELTGNLNSGIQTIKAPAIDSLLASPQAPDSTRVLLIDGPAGIGKTQFIVNLAADRARNYLAKRNPLILHVQSRGRTLSYLLDLVAFNLQRLRLDTTYDQVPILAKHGLITIAIDGFDELADPDGYDLAWSQVSDLISSLRGHGSIILAGRETFIGRDRIVRDIASIRESIDDVAVFTLQPPNKGEALRWLSQQGWSADELSSVEGFLEPSSLALRPFFLKSLADTTIAASVSASGSGSVLSVLMNAMIEREVSKFGEAVERELTIVQRRSYIGALMAEVARDMADNASTALSDATLSWLVDVALPEEVSDSVRRLLKARSQVLAFLTNDDRPGYRRFYHEKFYEYFLSLVLIETVSEREISKPLARGIFGSSFLETFGSVISGGVPSDRAAEFLRGALRLASVQSPADRSASNAGTLVVSSLGLADLVEGLVLPRVTLEESRFAGTAAKAMFEEVVISQLDCRGGDIATSK